MHQKKIKKHKYADVKMGKSKAAHNKIFCFMSRGFMYILSAGDDYLLIVLLSFFRLLLFCGLFM